MELTRTFGEFGRNASATAIRIVRHQKTSAKVVEH